jgi:hypothetical protein
VHAAQGEMDGYVLALGGGVPWPCAGSNSTARRLRHCFFQLTDGAAKTAHVEVHQ